MYYRVWVKVRGERVLQHVTKNQQEAEDRKKQLEEQGAEVEIEESED